MDGTYGFVYCGNEGVGIGVFRVAGSQLTGTDLAGARYKGVVKENSDGTLALSFEMSVPAGVFLVQGSSAQDVTYSKQASVTVPAGFGDGKPFEVYIAPGPVTMMVRRIPDEFAPYAD